jgi:alpha-tubulin suppressor-like RCC1 family protein
MLGRKRISSGVVIALVAVGAVVGACSDKATTGPSKVQGKDFASALRSVDGDQQIGPVAAALTKQLIVKVIDANGLPVEGATVTFQVRGGGGSVNPPANTSSISGLVSATWTLGTALGANKVVALLTNNSVLDSAVFTATATAGAPRVITVTGGNNQTSNVGRRLGTLLGIKLADQFGYPISGVKVTWTPGALSGSVVPTNDTTVADGSATAAWTLGTNAFAPQTVIASAPGITPVVFTVTTKPDTGRIITITGGNNQSGGVSTTLTTPVTVTVTDQYLNPILGDTVTFGDSITAGGKVSPIKVPTAADGTASSNWTLGVYAGPAVQRVTHPIAGVQRVRATATVTYSKVIAGNSFACGIATSNSYAYCWGAADAGQLGKGAIFSNVQAPNSPVSTTPDSLAGPFLQIKSVSGGRGGMCALSAGLQLYCWGRIPGLSTVASAFAGLQNIVIPPQNVIVTGLAVGQDHICLTELSGVGFCTGINLHGQLGDSVTAPASPAVGTYVSIAAGASGVRHWALIRAGQSHSCGVLKADPTGVTKQLPFCWGLNTSGQLGRTTFSTSPDFRGTPDTVKFAGAVTGVDSTSITTGAQHSCVIATLPAGVAGTVYCWGDNGYGQLGSVTTLPVTASASPVAVAGLPPAATQISAGEFHTCAVVITGAAYCWGRNDFGQLGPAGGGGGSTPVPVPGNFTSISVGATFTCGLTNAGAASRVLCWGDNTFGQLGNGTLTASPMPYPVNNQPKP